MGGSTAKKFLGSCLHVYTRIFSYFFLSHEWTLMHTNGLQGGNKVVGSK